MNEQTFSPVGYGLAGKTELRAVGEGKMYSYIFAGNGVFCYARRPGLEALVPVNQGGIVIRGLANLRPFLLLDRRVPIPVLDMVRTQANVVYPLEMLFYLHLERDEWRLVIPEQVQTPGSCVPVSWFGEDTTRALVEVHSHGAYAPDFSAMDDQDEQGFRIFTVIGLLDERPTIRTRVGVFGSFWEIPSQWVYDLPEGLADAVSSVEGGLP